MGRGAAGQTDRTGARTPAAEHEAHAKQQPAYDLCPVDRRKRVDLVGRHPTQGQGVGQAEHGGDHGGEHDLQHGHVLEVEDAGELARAAEAGPFQDKAEGQPQEQGRCPGIGRAELFRAEIGLNHAIASLQTRPRHSRRRTRTS
jgi:hypothetical protein